MFDPEKHKQLQNKSHIRGKLNKQFYSSEQQQLQRKRRQMKQMLDLQIEQKKRKQQRDKMETEHKQRMEDERIRNYYQLMDEREKKGQAQPQPAKKNPSGVYQSLVQNAHKQEYAANGYGNSNVIRSKSRSYYQDQPYYSGDIPVMPLMQSPQRQREREKGNYSGHMDNNEGNASGNGSGVMNGNVGNSNLRQSKVHRNSAGNIPLLQLNQDQQKKQKKKSKRNPTKRDQKPQQSLYQNPASILKPSQKQRRQTLPDQDSSSPPHLVVPSQPQPFPIPHVHNHNPRQQTQLKQIFSDLNQQLEEENKQLKKQLKKKQQAISLLMGAVRSNGKLDKFRVQAQKILHGQNSLDAKIGHGISMITMGNSQARKQSVNGYEEVVKEKEKEKESMLPRLKLKHQSIMHDYMFGSARRAQVLKSKTFK